VRSALAIEGKLTLRGESAPDVRVLAQGRSLVVDVDGLRHAFELRRTLDFALPREVRAQLAHGLRIADVLLELRIRGRMVASLGGPGQSWLAARLGFPGVRLAWAGLVLTLFWPGPAAGLGSHRRSD
jgi:hypothetical protein